MKETQNSKLLRCQLATMFDLLIAMPTHMVHEFCVSACWTASYILGLLQSLVGCSHSLLGVRCFLLWHGPKYWSEPCGYLEGILSNGRSDCISKKTADREGDARGVGRL